MQTGRISSRITCELETGERINLEGALVAEGIEPEAE